MQLNFEYALSITDVSLKNVVFQFHDTDFGTKTATRYKFKTAVVII